MTDNCINVFAGSMRNHTKALTRDEVKQIYLEAFYSGGQRRGPHLLIN